MVTNGATGDRCLDGGDPAASRRRNRPALPALLSLAVAAAALARYSRRSAPGGDRGGRRLRNEAFHAAPWALDADPRSVVAKAPDVSRAAAAAGPVAVTAYLLNYPGIFHHEYSLFTSDALDRYGTGRLRWDAVEHAPSGCKGRPRALRPARPCLVVGPADKHDPARENRDCMQSRCKVMASNDERCEVAAKDSSRYGVRQYFSVTRPDQVYLPLGMRIDAWQSFHKLKRKDEADSGSPFTIPPASQRKYAFNAIFSKNTNFQRLKLANIIERHERSAEHDPMPIYASIAQKWNRVVNDPANDAVATDQYMAALLDSVFTLSPTGKNPESFRLFEAVEAGSIPVLVRDEMLNRAPQLSANGRRPLDEGQLVHCEGSLSHWLEAPVVILDSWDELFPTIERLLQDVGALEETQRRLRQWYTEYMNEVVRVFEDYMLASPSKH